MKVELRVCLCCLLGSGILLTAVGCDSGTNVPIAPAPPFTPPANAEQPKIPKAAEKAGGSPKNIDPTKSS